jgi:hypothetical protein
LLYIDSLPPKVFKTVPLFCLTSSTDGEGRASKRVPAAGFKTSNRNTKARAETAQTQPHKGGGLKERALRPASGNVKNKEGDRISDE